MITTIEYVINHNGKKINVVEYGNQNNIDSYYQRESEYTKMIKVEA